MWFKNVSGAGKVLINKPTTKPKPKVVEKVLTCKLDDKGIKIDKDCEEPKPLTGPGCDLEKNPKCADTATEIKTEEKKVESFEDIKEALENEDLTIEEKEKLEL